MKTNDVLDGVLARFAETGPEFGPGLSNHGPMASEALVALGRADAVEPWAEQYATRLGEHPTERKRIEAGDWREALGEVTRVGDWIAFFDRSLGEQHWTAALETWTARLVPGIMAGAMHGILRTAHAVRALRGGETPQRLHEFAEGLGYWSARYQELPSREGGQRLPTIEAAVVRVPRIDDSQRRRFLIFDSVRVLDEEHFGPAINYVSVEGDTSAFVSDLTRVFARQYLANANTAVIAFVHTVTGPSAVRILAPHLSEETTRSALRYAWQACAAVYATYARGETAPVIRAGDEVAIDIDDLIDRAVRTGDEHAIKFTEACLREYALAPDAAFILAADNAVKRLGP